jgi:thiol-disulfide isomerase/thioredoxin
MERGYEGTVVKELTIDDFDHLPVLKDKKCSLVLIHAKWCPHCQQLRPIWIQLAKLATYFNIYAIDSAKERLVRDLSESGLNIHGFPSIWLYKQGRPVREYIGVRDLNSLLKFTMENCG